MKPTNVKKYISLLLLLTLLASPLRVQALDMNGHIEDTEWFGLNDKAGYNSLSVDITPEKWEGGSHGYYYANNARFSNGTNIYGGLQTNGYDGARPLGKMAIFSIWNATTGIAESGGIGIPFDGEGTGYSVRLPFDWQVGTTYRFTIYIDRDASTGDRLWGASITDMHSGTTTRIGRIYAPVTFGKLHSPVTFHEKYIGTTKSCSDLQPSQVRFSNMTANDTIRATRWKHYFIKSTRCGDTVRLEDVADGYRSSIGNTSEPSTPTSVTRPKPGEQAATAGSQHSSLALIPLTILAALIAFLVYRVRKSGHR